MGENRKKVNAILRKTAERAERANKRAVTCRKCTTHLDEWWNYCAVCGTKIFNQDLGNPSTTDRPFGCPPDEEAK